MKTLIYSTIDAKKISTFNVSDFAAKSILNQIKDKHFFRFSQANLQIKSHSISRFFSKIILEELGLDKTLPENSLDLELIILENIEYILENIDKTHRMKMHINGLFNKYMREFQEAKGHLVMIVSKSNDVTTPQNYSYNVIDGMHCYCLLNQEQTHKLFNAFKITTESNMMKLVYKTKDNKKVTYNIDSTEKMLSILKMKEDALYYDFLVNNHQVEEVRVGQPLVKYVLDNLDMDYIKCPTSRMLDSVVKDKAAELFKLSEIDKGIEKYLSFNMRFLHLSFINKVSNPLTVVSNNDNCQESPEYFVKKTSDKYKLFNYSSALH